MEKELSKNECINEILRMRAGEDGKLSQKNLEDISASLPSLDDIIEGMDRMIEVLERLGDKKGNSIRAHIEYMLKKGVDFRDSRFDNLFVDRNVSYGVNSTSSSGVSKKFSASLDYSYREKLSGFISSCGSLEWDENRINDFIGILKNC
ncbi:hypothetical protein PAEPH01_1548 [Pancytospora epiphaga]|nr:hypothetical protein PAEPH01_1548 [Pancytospora epiphaga]